jgi:ABC-type bacteriocin/lantibiotic exporter with double-glycine peptidase domain
MLVAFQSLTSSFLGPVNNLLGLGSALQDLEGHIDRLDDVLRNPVVDKDTMPLVEGGPVRLKGQLELKDVRFGYNPLAPPLIEGLSFKLNPGQRVALMGASGSGKSTIARLIAGLYEPSSGEILFDEKARAAIPRSVMTNSLEVVDQEILLFTGTIKENLTLWDPTIPDEQIVQAARDAAIHDDILSLPDGYNSRLLEGGANLSGGQRQRLEIARALCAEPSILVLDEATSALDAETERIIDRNLRRRGCSLVMVAHRLSTIRDADEIIVLDQGKVVERGRHDEMLAESGPYWRLLHTESSLADEYVASQ